MPQLTPTELPPEGKWQALTQFSQEPGTLPRRDRGPATARLLAGAFYIVAPVIGNNRINIMYILSAFGNNAGDGDEM